VTVPELIRLKVVIKPDSIMVETADDGDLTGWQEATRILAAKDAEIAAFFTPSCADASHIVKFLKASCGDEFTPAIQNDNDKMWAFVNGLQGQDFQIVVVKNGQWNNITTAIKAKKKTPEPQITEDDLFAFTDDTVNL
jgi:hypothetical protein